MSNLNHARSDNELLYTAINPEPYFQKKSKEHLPQKLKRCKGLITQYWALLIIPLAFWVGNHFAIVINQTDSLPQKVWIMILNKTPKRYDYIAFKPPPKSGLPASIILHKQVMGVEGDIVTHQKRDILINGQYVATAKTRSLQGEPLALGPIGTLKEGQYYVHTSHPDSFDSRYQKMGWIDINSILGVLYPLW